MTPIMSEVFLRAQSDERLVRLARHGHHQAFVAIVARYQRELLAFAARSGPEARAEDVVQQALLNALVALRDGTEVTHLRGWLYAIVRRGLARAAVQAPIADGDLAAAHTEPLEDVVLRRARARDTLAAVRGLPERQREALLATVFGGYSRSDLARDLGQSEGVVRQLVHRARVNLRGTVGAIVPYPVLRWVLASQADVPAAGLAASAAVASSGGMAAKLGIVLASGAVATGVFALPGAAPRHPEQRARATSPTSATAPVKRAVPRVVARQEVAQVTPPRAPDRVAGSPGRSPTPVTRGAGERPPGHALAHPGPMTTPRDGRSPRPRGGRVADGGGGGDGASAPAPVIAASAREDPTRARDGSPDGGGQWDGASPWRGGGPGPSPQANQAPPSGSGMSAGGAGGRSDG